MVTSRENLLGAFLRDRRAKLDPVALGFGAARRRTPGLRREEVAQRANVSATWYTWLEQGRGGAPSADVLDGIANALLLTPAEREHLFLLAQNRPPEVQYRPPEGVTPRLQRMLDALELSPALTKSSAWDILAWNRAVAAVMTDYGTLPPERRNLLRMFFGEWGQRKKLPTWERDARLALATFRRETARAGASEQARALVDELSQSSPELAAMWLDNDVSAYGEGTKLIEHPVAGQIVLEYASFAVDEHPDLGLVVYTPATPEDLERVRTLIRG